MPTTITIPKIEYQKLQRIRKQYEVIRELVSADLFESPPTKDVKKILREFKKTGRYNDKFLKGIGQGLRESTYFQSA